MAKCTLVTPVLPSELLAYILKQHHTHQTTLVICSRRTDFITSVVHEVVRDEQVGLEESASVPNTADLLRSRYPHLVTSPLHQLVTSRHIRTLYMPTVTHLRSYFTVAGVASNITTATATATVTSKSALAGITSSSKVPVLPGDDETETTKSGIDTLIVMYGFLELHRDTSEWSAQGLSHSCSTLVEYAHQLGLRGEVLLAEPAWCADDGGSSNSADMNPAGGDDGDIGEIDEHDGHPQGAREYTSDDFAASSPHERSTSDSKRGWRKRIDLEDLLTEDVPLLTGGGSTLRKLGIDGDEPGWAGRTVEVGRVLKRWLRFRQADWNQPSRT